MGVVVTISDESRAFAEELVGYGWYASIDDVVEAALRQARDHGIDEEVGLGSLLPEDRAAVKEGLADVDAGRTVPAEEVFDALIGKYTAMAEKR